MVAASNFLSIDSNFLSSPIDGFLPRKAIVPLMADKVSSPEILVTEGSFVKEGETIAKSREIFTHSPIPGIVEKIEQR